MVATRPNPRRARSRGAAGRVFGEYRRGQHAGSVADNRWDRVELDDERSTQSGASRTLLPG
ncbi:hypothetical protein [Halorhabdus tiamatea]|uniref:Uncharacterized protein n=2 Tax=Halorhabdus TaxID=146825 RepID=F7PGA2_9EURY|nr:hypothetical protein [Halorhabdus tiamatea]CCQ33154.1 hypothetical protein HTIA_1016 [Halorhabdus tiamatea SARL4B]